jgi:hypothetical protein
MDHYLVLLITILFLGGCAKGTVPHAFLPEGYSDDEIEVIRAQAKQWVERTNGRCHALIVDVCDDDACSEIRNTDSGFGNCRGYQSYGGVTIHNGCAELPDADKYVITASAGPDLGRIVLHELGHTFGIQHLSDEDVMGPYLYPDGPSELTDADVAAARCN